MDVGVLGVPDPYSQEIPAAFVALSAKFAEAAKHDPKEGERIKQSIAQVHTVMLSWPERGSIMFPQLYVSTAKMRYKWLDGGIQKSEW